jgi:hypothetical protein
MGPIPEEGRKIPVMETAKSSRWYSRILHTLNRVQIMNDNEK